MESLHKNRKFKTCTTCNKQISVQKFARHLATHLPEVDRRKFKCSVDLCSKIYYSQKSVDRHVKDIHSSTPRTKFKCDLCSKEYCQNSILQIHVRSIHSESFTKYGCSLCDAEFKTKRGRDDHVVATHTGEKAFLCEKCPAKFSTASGLSIHRKSHSEARPHLCRVCLKQFKHRQHLQRHEASVHPTTVRTKDFLCLICAKSFYTKSDLGKHGKIHADGGEFSCYFCKREFLQRSDLDYHLRTHTQEKPFICLQKLCKYSCNHSGNLLRHKRLHHSSPGDEATSTKIWTCYFCSKTVTQPCHLVIHMRSHTLEEPFPCRLCKKAYKDVGNLGRHISTHTKEKPYTCPHCGKCFSMSSYLKSHVATHQRERIFL